MGADGMVLCPFHEDHTPSLELLPENRWRCFPCGRSGSVIDFVADHEKSTFNEAVEMCKQILRELPNEYVGKFKSYEKVRPEFRLQEAIDRTQNAAKDDFILKQLCEKYNWPPATWLRERWRVGSEWTSIVIPYYLRSGELYTYRVRRAGEHVTSASGRSNRCLYGEWLDTDTRRQVLLCEGESDTWTADFLLGDKFACLGVPGAGTVPIVDGLQNRDCTLVFDGDTAGRQAVEKWRDALRGVAHSVTVWEMPEGVDLREYIMGVS